MLALDEDSTAAATATAALTCASRDPAGIISAFALEPCTLPATPQPSTAVVGALLRARVKPVSITLASANSSGGGGGFLFGEGSAAALTLEGGASVAGRTRTIVTTSTAVRGGNGDDDGGGDGTNGLMITDAAPQQQQPQPQSSPPTSPSIEEVELPLLHKPRQPSALLLLAHDAGVVGQEWLVAAVGGCTSTNAVVEPYLERAWCTLYLAPCTSHLAPCTLRLVCDLLVSSIFFLQMGKRAPLRRGFTPS